MYRALAQGEDSVKIPEGGVGGLKVTNMTFALQAPPLRETNHHKGDFFGTDTLPLEEVQRCMLAVDLHLGANDATSSRTSIFCSILCMNLI